MRLIFSIIFVLLTANFVSGQQIEGNVSSKNTDQGLENIRIKATSLNDTTKQKETTTDFAGNYILKDIITGNNDLQRFGDDKIIITKNGSQLEIYVTSSKNISHGKLYTVDGKTISVTQFQKVGLNKFKAAINIRGIAEQTVLFSDGVHPNTKIIPSRLSIYGSQTIDFSVNNLKGANTNDNDIKFELDDDASIDNYQPMEVIKTVDLENTNYFDFKLSPWQKFYSTINFNIETLQGDKVNNAAIKVKDFDSVLEYLLNTDANGDASIINIEIPHIEGDKGIPDSLDFAVEITGDDIKTKLDTLWKVSAGEMFVNYHNLTLKEQQEFFANLFFNLQDKFGNLQKNTNLEVKGVDNEYNFNIITNENGNAQITNIKLPTTNGNAGDLDFAVEVKENEYLEMFRDTIRNVGVGDLNKNYDNLTPKQQEFFANIYNLVKSEKTGNTLPEVLAKLWTQGKQDTIKITTGTDGKAYFKNLEIPALNEITPGTLKKVLELSGNNLETKLDTITVTDKNYNKTYYMTEKEVVPEDKEYTLVINSKDDEGNNLPNVNWIISNTNNAMVGSGNTGNNSIDTLQFLNPNNSLNLKINSDKEEYTNYNTTKNVLAGQSTITTVNELMKYLYELQASGKDSETKALLDSVEVQAFLNGQLLMSGNSLTNTELNLQTTQAGHSLDLKVLMNRNGYIKSDSIPITINEGQTNTLDYELVKEQVTPTEKQYTLIINSKDGEDNNLPNVNWTVSTTTGNEIGSGNTGSNSLDTLLFQNTNPNLNVTIQSNKEEHTDYSNQTNLTAEQNEVRITQNELLKYLYELNIIGKDSETKSPLDSLNAKIYLNGQLLMSGNSLDNTELNLQTTQAGHSLDLKVLMNRNGYIKSDSIPITINEGQENNLVYELVKEQTNNDAVAYLWRQFLPDITQTGTKANVIIKNLEFNYSDTIYALGNNTWWQDTVLVKLTGTTEYEIKYLTTVQEGKIPYYPLKKIITLEATKQSIGMDTLKSIEQQVRFKGDAKGSDGGEPGIVNVTFRANDGNTYSTTTTADGKYDLGIFPVGTTGDIDFVIPTSNPKSSTYFNHRDIPVGGTYNTKQGTVPLPTKVTAFKDSVLTYNPMMIQKQWTYPVTGEKVTIHPEYLKDLEGTSYNASWALWGEQRVYNTPNSDNPDWATQMGAFIEKHTGVSFKVIVVDTPRKSGVQITSLDQTYLESIRNQMGVNVETKTTEAGLTNVHSAGSIDGMIFHSTSDITLKCPEQGTEANDITYAIGMREFVGRNGQFGMTDQYLSFLNGALDYNIKVTDMTQDFANVAIIYTNMSSRAKKQTHTGLYTISED